MFAHSFFCAFRHRVGGGQRMTNGRGYLSRYIPCQISRGVFRAHCRFCTIIRKTAKQAWTFWGFRVINVLRRTERQHHRGKPGKDRKMMKYEMNTDDRKVLVKRLGELTGMKPAYTYMPRCAYECGAYSVERNGDLMVEEADADAKSSTPSLPRGSSRVRRWRSPPRNPRRTGCRTLSTNRKRRLRPRRALG